MSSVLLECAPMRADDWAAVWEILRPVFRAGETYPMPPDIGEDAARAAWSDPPAVAPPQAAAVVARAGGSLVGAYYIKPNQPALGAHVCNCGYVVAAEMRGRGIGAALCVHSQREALKLGYRAMQYNLVVSTNAAGIRTWKKNGFAIVGTLPKAFRHSRLGFVDAFVMYKELTQD